VGYPAHAFLRCNPWKVLTFHGLSAESFLFFLNISAKSKTKLYSISRCLSGAYEVLFHDKKTHKFLVTVPFSAPVMFKLLGSVIRLAMQGSAISLAIYRLIS
jgi:hypothetical protein